MSRPLVSKEIYVPVLILFAVLLVLMPRNPKFNYDYKKGSPWNYETLIAQFDFPILKTEAQMQEQREMAGSSVVPYYRWSDDIVGRNLKAAQRLSFGDSRVKNAAIDTMTAVYSKGIVPDEGVRIDKNVDVSNAVLFIQKDKRAQKYPVTEVYLQSEARDKLLSLVTQEVGGANVDSLLLASGIYDLVVPNLEYDKQTTQLIHAESADDISPTIGFVNAGDLIVSEGEIVTSEIAQVLDSYKVEYEDSVGSSGPGIFRWLGNGLLALVLIAALLLTLYMMYPKIYVEPNSFAYMILVFGIASVGAILGSKLSGQLIYMIPFTLTALYLQAFFKNKTVLPICILSLIPLLAFAHDGVVLFVMFTVADIVCIYTFNFFSRGWRQFINAGIVFLTLLVVYFAFRLIDLVNGNAYYAIIYLFIGSFMAVAGYPLVYLFEKLFNLVSSSRLQELCDTNNPLLQKLEATAPGTFQHSLQVMSMADACARAIGANVLLVRAGALYHDLGKMENPQCFIENESLVPGQAGEYHKNLTAKESARDIIRHVDDGLVIADKARLPQVIKDFISSHHGTALTGYFYNKWVNMGGDPEDKAEFTYHGSKPRTREEMILMLCDTIEAASRTLKERTPEAFTNLVNSMVDAKMRDGQFEDCELSIKDLNVVRDVVMSYLGQLYHGRVAYPKRNQKTTK